MFKLPYIREYYELLKNQSFKKKKILLCGRRFGKPSIPGIAWELMNEGLITKEQYEEVVKKYYENLEKLARGEYQ